MPKVNYYLILSFFLIIAIKLSTEAYQNSLLIHAEIWAEAGTNYFVNSQSHFFSSLLKTDCSYLVFIQRIISWSYWLFFDSPEYFFKYCGLISLIIISLSCSYINLSINKVYIESNVLRFILSILLAFVKDYELHTFVNFVYFAWIPLILIFFNERINNLRTLYKVPVFLIAALIILSKGIFIILAPLVVIILIISKNLNRWKFQLYLLLPLSIQGLMLFIDIDKVKKFNFFSIQNAIDLTWSSLIGPFFNAARTLFYHHDSDEVKITLFTLFIVWLFRNKNKLLLNLNSSQKVLLLSSIAVLFLNHILIYLSSDILITHFPRLPIDVIEGRGFYISAVTIFISSIIVTCSLIKGNSSKVAGIFLVIILIWSVFKPKFELSDLKIPATKNYPLSLAVKQLARETYCIPINPYSWYMLKNCHVIYKPENFEAIDTIEIPGIYKISPNISYRRIYTLALNIGANLQLKVINKNRIETLQKHMSPNNLVFFISENGIIPDDKLIFYDERENHTPISRADHNEPSQYLSNILLLGE